MTISAITPASTLPTPDATAASFDAALDRATAASGAGTTTGPASGDSLIDKVAGPREGMTIGWGGSQLGQGRLECPSSIDLNGDGRIGLDELLAAMGLTGTNSAETLI
ncbi:MAG: hypothetical protein ACOYOJ_14005 [Alsobacter sp.]